MKKVTFQRNHTELHTKKSIITFIKSEPTKLHIAPLNILDNKTHVVKSLT